MQVLNLLMKIYARVSFFSALLPYNTCNDMVDKCGILKIFIVDITVKSLAPPSLCLALNSKHGLALDVHEFKCSDVKHKLHHKTTSGVESSM